MSQSVTSADPSTRQDGGLQNKGPERSKVHAVKLNHMPQEKRPGKESSCCQPTKKVVHETVNPWLSSTTKVTCLEWIKLVIMFPIALVRLLLIVFLVVPLAWMFCKVATCCHPTGLNDQSDLEPMGSCRRAMLWPFRFLVRVLLFLCGYMYIHEKGCCSCTALGTAPVIVSNHVSFIDPAFLFYKFLPCAAGNIGLMQVPILSAIFRAITPIAVDRDSKEGRSRAALSCILRPQSAQPVTDADYERLKHKETKNAELDVSTEKLKDRKDWLVKKNKIEEAALERRKAVTKGDKPAYPPILVFPEGTTTTSNTLLQFKKGAFLSGQPVQPVVVQYPFCNFEMVWGGDANAGWVAWRMLSQVYNCMTVEYLPVVTPTEDEKKDPDLFATRVRELMGEKIDDVYLTEHSYEDLRLLNAAQACYDSTSTGIKVTNDVTFATLDDHLNLTADKAVKLIEKFHAMDKDGNGMINEKEFVEGLDLDPDSEFSHQAFQIMTEGNGEFDFRTFVQSLVLVSSGLGPEKKVEFIFDLYDNNNDGTIDENELIKIMERTPAMKERKGTKVSRTDSSTARAECIATKVLDGKQCLNREEFKVQAELHPELLKYPMEDR